MNMLRCSTCSCRIYLRDDEVPEKCVMCQGTKFVTLTPSRSGPVPWDLSYNDRTFLKSLRIIQE
jgi:hypothetical protein